MRIGGVFHRRDRRDRFSCATSRRPRGGASHLLGSIRPRRRARPEPGGGGQTPGDSFTSHLCRYLAADERIEVDRVIVLRSGRRMVAKQAPRVDVLPRTPPRRRRRLERLGIEPWENSEPGTADRRSRSRCCARCGPSLSSLRGRGSHPDGAQSAAVQRPIRCGSVVRPNGARRSVDGRRRFPRCSPHARRAELDRLRGDAAETDANSADRIAP